MYSKQLVKIVTEIKSFVFVNLVRFKNNKNVDKFSINTY